MQVLAVKQNIVCSVLQVLIRAIRIFAFQLEIDLDYSNKMKLFLTFLGWSNMSWLVFQILEYTTKQHKQKKLNYWVFIIFQSGELGLRS